MTEQDLMEAEQAFWDFVEQLAEEHEVTADYIIYEFILQSYLTFGTVHIKLKEYFTSNNEVSVYR